MPVFQGGPLSTAQDTISTQMLVGTHSMVPAMGPIILVMDTPVLDNITMDMVAMAMAMVMATGSMDTLISMAMDTMDKWMAGKNDRNITADDDMITHSNNSLSLSTSLSDTLVMKYRTIISLYSLFTDYYVMTGNIHYYSFD